MRKSEIGGAPLGTDTNEGLGRVKIKTGFYRYWPFHKTLGTIVEFGLNNEIRVRPDQDPSQILILYPHEVDPRPGTVLPQSIAQARFT
jgi:hypothetical protein